MIFQKSGPFSAPAGVPLLRAGRCRPSALLLHSWLPSEALLCTALTPACHCCRGAFSTCCCSPAGDECLMLALFLNLPIVSVPLPIQNARLRRSKLQAKLGV